MGKPISQVNMVLRTASAVRAGFGTPIFLAPSLATIRRVSTYTDTPADYSADHAVTAAYNAFKSPTPSVSEVKVARVASSLVLTPEAPEDGKVYSFLIGDGDGNTGTCTFTAGASSTAEDVVDNLLADIASFTDIADEVTETKSGTGASATLSITVTGNFYIKDIVGLAETYTPTETYAEALAAARLEDDSFYFVTAATKDTALVKGLADAVQALNKIYFTADSSTDTIGNPYSVASTTVSGIVKANNYSRTTSVWDEDLTNYPECRYVGVNAPYSPDTRAVVWDGREIVGASVATNASGNEITATEQVNLDSYNASYITTTSVGPRILGGKCGNGEWIDNIRTQDTIIARVGEALDTLILNQAGKKLVGGRRGIALVESAITKALNPFVGSDAIESFTVDTSNATIDFNTRTLSGVSFTVVLAGAILRVVVDGAAVNEEV